MIFQEKNWENVCQNAVCSWQPYLIQPQYDNLHMHRVQIYPRKNITYTCFLFPQITIFM